MSYHTIQSCGSGAILLDTEGKYKGMHELALRAIYISYDVFDEQTNTVFHRDEIPYPGWDFHYDYSIPYVVNPGIGSFLSFEGSDGYIYRFLIKYVPVIRD